MVKCIPSSGTLVLLQIKGLKAATTWRVMILVVVILIIITVTITARINMIVAVVVHWLSHVWLVATPWTAALQASLFFTISLSLLKLMSTEWMMLSNHLILYHPFLLFPSIFPSIRSFPMSQLFALGGQYKYDIPIISHRFIIGQSQNKTLYTY